MKPKVNIEKPYICLFLDICEGKNLKKGFDNKKYLLSEKKAILFRTKKFRQLYFEIGGHLLYDGHASRVLPSYDPKNKIKLLKSLKTDLGIIYCVSAKAIERNTPWSNSGLAPDKLALKEVNALRKEGLNVLGFAVTLFDGEKRAKQFIDKLKNKKETVIVSSWINGYPNNLTSVFGKKGFDKQPFFLTDKKIVAVTGTGANNGKLFFCLNQIYHLDKLGISAGYAKLETFPIWNLPITHEVNIAYEAATADILDKLEIDPLYKKYYKKASVNYNRDIDSFPILKRIISKVSKKDSFMHSYNSPTDMGINFAKVGIIDDNIVREASRQEILKRYEEFLEKYKKGEVSSITIKRMKEIMLKVKWPV